jgi:hypothetical protein
MFPPSTGCPHCQAAALRLAIRGLIFDLERF